MRLRLKQQRLIELLASSALSQNHWALKVGVARGHWSEIVNGKHPYPSAKTRTRMLETFNVPLEQLFEVEVGVDPLVDVDFRRAIADRYLIDTEIGQGGMGAVYLARDVRHGRVVAVKVISPEAISGIGLTQFQREISTIAQLHHQNILPLFDSGVAGGHPYYVMPLVRTGSLRARLRDATRLSLVEVLPLVRGIAAALHYAHGERVLHCDVKPENVLLSGEHPWVMDFGIARKLHSEMQEWSLRKHLDVSAGTPAYVSPEQASGETDLDARSDVYSLACLTFEMLSGRTPFGGRSTEEIVARRFAVPPPPLRGFAPELPAAVESVLERAMSLPREHRPGSAALFAAELDEAARSASRALARMSIAMTRTVARTRGRLGVGPSRMRGGVMRDFLSDVVLAARGIKRSPGFAAIIVLTLGLALGASATMFGVVDRLLLRGPAHITRPDRVFRVHVSRFFGGGLRNPSPAMSYPAFTDVRDRSRTFADVAAFAEGFPSYGTAREGRQLTAIFATGRYFPLLGTRPALGRFFADAEDQLPTGAPVAVVSHTFWSTTLVGDSGAVGRALLINGRPFTVIGVAPEGFGGTQLASVDVWIPLSAAPAAWKVGGDGWITERRFQFLRVLVRLRDSAEEKSASADAARAYHEGHADYNEYESKAVATLVPLQPGRDPTTGAVEARLSVWLLGMAGIVLVIACANVANLMLARALVRRGEVAVRRALGGTVTRLVRQFATESLLLSALGCGAGLGVAWWGSRLVRKVLVPDASWDANPLDGRVLAFTAVATVLAAVLAGIVPLARGSRSDLAASMHGAGRGFIGHPRRLLNSLLGLQAALSTVLLVGAVLFVKSLRRVERMDLGFAPSQVLDVSIRLSQTGATPDEENEFYRQAAERLRALPGVETVGAAIGGPFMTSYGASVRAPGGDSLPSQTGGGPYYTRVTAGALEAMQVKLLRGRLVTEADDRPGAPPVVVLTQRIAWALWPDRDPLTQCVIVREQPPCAPVVGVIADIHRQSLIENPFFLFFLPLAVARATYGSAASVPEAMLVRVKGRPEAMIEPVRRQIAAMRSDLPFIPVEPYERLIAPEKRSWQLGAMIFTAFGMLSLLMAAIGVYGVLSFGVTQRTPELGIRAALGASPANVLRLIVRAGVGTAALGVAVGSIAALLLSGRIEPLLFETPARDPVAFAVAGGVLLAIAVTASLIPGARAARVDPLRALRTD